MSQQYSLRWNNHQPNFISMFTTLLNTQTLVDVTLAAEGKHLQAHKVVLSACSTYFQALFVDNPSRHPIVILKDVTFADLRTMVDFMYYGEVNVTEEQLPQVLDTAKLLKIKGLTEMPDSTSLTRAQGGAGAATEFVPPAEPSEPQRVTSPTSPSIKRRRRRKSSTGSTSLSVIAEETRGDDNQTVELVRDGITLSSLPQRRRDFHDERHQDTSQQTADNPHNMSMDPLGVENPVSMAQEAFAAGLKLRRSMQFRRQNRIPDEEMRHQMSEPVPAPPSVPELRKHDSYPQYAKKRRQKCPEAQQQVAMTVSAVPAAEGERPRASHTPAMRAGPPLSCNFCWNTVDECGRILRRKTQYHCPECRTNLCIVPCFHEYHEAETVAAPNQAEERPTTSPVEVDSTPRSSETSVGARKKKPKPGARIFCYSDTDSDDIFSPLVVNYR